MILKEKHTGLQIPTEAKILEQMDLEFKNQLFIKHIKEIKEGFSEMQQKQENISKNQTEISEMKNVMAEIKKTMD